MFREAVSFHMESTGQLAGQGSSGSASTRPTGKYLRYLSAAVILAVLVGAVYAGFVATHTFTYPSTTASIVNRSYAIGFLANEGTPVLTSCGVSPCFHVDGTANTTVVVSASSAISGGSGVTLTMIQVIPLTQSCSATQPTVTTGLTLIPLPGQAPAAINLKGQTDYNYCIYYTSSASIVTGTFSVNYSA